MELTKVPFDLNVTLVSQGAIFLFRNPFRIDKNTLTVQLIIDI